jgi:signal peptidase I
MNKAFKLTVDIILIIVIMVLGLYFILRLLGVAEIYKVKTGSMEDGIHAGDYILIFKKKNYHVGDVVTFKKDGYHVTHRIIEKNGNKVVTKGDANNTADEEIKVSNIVGKVIYHGGLLNFIIDFKFAIASGLLGLYLLSMFFDGKEKSEE